MVSSTASPNPPGGSLPPSSGARRRPPLAAYLAGLRIYAALGIWLAIVTSVAIWLAATGIAGVTPLIGLVLGCGVLGVAAYLATNAAATWNGSRRQLLRDWGDSLRADMSAPSAAAMLARVDSTLQRLEADRGPQWISGDGYVSVSRSLAELEVAAMDGMRAGELIDVAQFDKMRLAGSAVANRDALLADLNNAIAIMQRASPQQPAAAAPTPPAPPPVPASALGPNPPADPSSASAQAAARMTVKDVRRALNDYRDSSRENLANLRRKTLDAVTLAGVLGFFLTLLGALNGSDSNRVQLGSGAALFLVAAIVGVIAALNGLSNLTKAEDDFGLAGARLIATAVLSGLAGVGGVLLIYLSGAAGALANAVGASAAAASGASATASSIPLTDVFNLGKYPVTLVVAAVFGAAPSLLITSLTKLGDKYANNLTSTHPSTTSGAGP